MKYLVLTLDYELYGDGSGDVFRHIVEPARQIINICEDNGVRLTVFFEAMEYIRLKEQWDSGNRMKYSHDPIEAIETQIQGLAKAGHDVQLHVHPQWFMARYVNGQWEVDLTNWRLADFAGLPGYGIEELLRENKEALEALIRPVRPNYRCRILRAGAYNIVPSEAVYRAMVNVGLEIDSSVYPGGLEVSELSCYDFRAAPLSKDCWRVDPSDFCRSSESSKIVEFPVFALTQRRINKLSINRIRSYLQRLGQGEAKYYRVPKTTTRTAGGIGKIVGLLGNEALTWDFCLFDFRTHERYFRYIERHLSERNVFVLIGHPKGFTSGEALRRLVKHGKELGYRFAALSEVVGDSDRKGLWNQGDSGPRSPACVR